MLKTIKQQVYDVIQYSQNIPNPQVDDLIDKWLEAKRDFIEVFGGTIFEVPFPVTFNVTKEVKDARTEEFIRYILDEYGYTSLADFVKANKDSFYDNEVSTQYIRRDKIIPVGAKLIKAFKYFVDGKNALDDIQTRASQLIQEDVVTGKLCFSVHPLDYLSSSENTYNWRSCHALDGEYRAGNLSYMLDKSTIICYLKGADNVRLPMFPENVLWNNKKWRVLIHVSDNWDMLFAGRQYPFTSAFGLNEVKLNLLNVMRKDHWNYCDWTDPVISEVPDSYSHEYDLNDEYIAIRGNLYKMRDVVVDCENPLHFNDVLHSNFYKPHFTLINNRPWFKQEFSKVHVGAPCNCLRCNTNRIKLTESFMCDDCEIQYGEVDTETFTTCDCCGRRIFRDDAWYVNDDEICEDCLHEECFYCPECEEYHFNEHRVYIEKEDIHICDRCAEERD